MPSARSAQAERAAVAAVADRQRRDHCATADHTDEFNTLHRYRMTLTQNGASERATRRPGWSLFSRDATIFRGGWG